ncbi:MAG: site-specific integrase [Methyloceanibacter sp.]
MTRRVIEKPLDSKAARAKLDPRSKPYYRSLGPTLQIGYRKGKDTRRWVMRELVARGIYKVTSIAAADDGLKADGAEVLSYHQAEERARELHRKQADGDAPRGPYTVKQAIDDYVDHLDGRASQRDTRQRLAAYVPAKLADKEVVKLTSDELKMWFRGLAKAKPRLRSKKGAAKQNHREIDPDDAEAVRARKVSANRILGQLKAALNYAVGENKVAGERTPWRNVKPHKNVTSARVRYLQRPEARRLVNASDPQFRPLVQAALLTGCRYGELCRLKVSDFDSSAGTLFVQQSKSDRSRHVYLTAEGVAFFKRQCAGRSGSESLLGDWGPSHQLRPMKRACERAQIDPPIGFHGLRHTWASLAVQGGMDLMAVANALGHSTTRMVEQHYAHLDKGYMARQIDDHAPRFGIETDNVESPPLEN